VNGTPIAPTAIVEPTTTTVAVTTTTVAVTTTTTIAAVVASSTKKVTVTKNELPETGSDSFPLVALAIGLISAGLVVITRKRIARR
jgi:LPXTG-motif cell wall-anchored protein